MLTSSRGRYYLVRICTLLHDEDLSGQMREGMQNDEVFRLPEVADFLRLLRAPFGMEHDCAQIAFWKSSKTQFPRLRRLDLPPEWLRSLEPCRRALDSLAEAPLDAWKRLSKEGDPRIPRGFATWHQLEEAGDRAKELLQAVLGWAKEWGLDAGWCLNLAVRTLRLWAEDRWVLIDLAKLDPNDRSNGCVEALSHRIWGSLPGQLWDTPNLEIGTLPGWSPTEGSLEQWQDARLATLKNEVSQYVKSAKEWKAAAERHETTSRHDALRVYVRTIRYHVCNESARNLAEGYLKRGTRDPHALPGQIDEKSIRRDVDRTVKLLQLPPRVRPKGRPSTKK
jgi:hypothetical protein